MCYFGNREELTKKELKVVKDLGLKFRGKNEWIYFRSFEPGYAPYMLDQTQVVKLTAVLQQLYISLKELNEGKIKVNFEQGEIIYRRYDEKLKSWLTHSGLNFIPPYQPIIPVITDELLMTRLNKLKETKDELELDTLYLNAVINDKEFEKPILAKLLILADNKKGIIIDQDVLSPKDDEIQSIFGIFINYLLQAGKPKTVYVRDRYIEDYLKDLCDRLGVSLKVKGYLRTIDSFERGFLGKRFQ